MSPNLFLAVKTVFQPQEWFKHKDACKHSDLSSIQHRNDPVPGIYKHMPGRGWFLVATKPSASGAVGTITNVSPPRPVLYSKVLKRFLFDSDFAARTRQARISGEPKWLGKSGFFRLDDGISWVNCWDHDGEFKKGPWQRYCWDADEEKFRPMLVGDHRHGEDDEEWLARRNAKAKSRDSNTSRPSSTSRSASRSEDVEGEAHGNSSSSSSVFSTRASSFADASETRSYESSIGALVDAHGNLNVECAAIRSRTSSPCPSKPLHNKHTSSLHSRTERSTSRRREEPRARIQEWDFADEEPKVNTSADKAEVDTHADMPAVERAVVDKAVVDTSAVAVDKNTVDTPAVMTAEVDGHGHEEK